MEIWKDIQGYEGLYSVSNEGRVWSFRRGGRILTGKDNGNGYLKVGLYDRTGKRTQFYIHRLVAEAFIPNPDSLEFVNHIDAKKNHNDAKNLEWVTPQGNSFHAIQNDLVSSHIKVTLINLETFERLKFRSQVVASEYLGRERSYVSKRVNRGNRTVTSWTGKKYGLELERRAKHDERRGCRIGESVTGHRIERLQENS